MVAALAIHLIATAFVAPATLHKPARSAVATGSPMAVSPKMYMATAPFTFDGYSGVNMGYGSYGGYGYGRNLPYSGGGYNGVGYSAEDRAMYRGSGMYGSSYYGGGYGPYRSGYGGGGNGYYGNGYYGGGYGRYGGYGGGYYGGMGMGYGGMRYGGYGGGYSYQPSYASTSTMGNMAYSAEERAGMRYGGYGGYGGNGYYGGGYGGYGRYGYGYSSPRYSHVSNSVYGQY